MCSSFALNRSCFVSDSLLTYFGVHQAPRTEWHIQVTDQEPDDATDPEFREVVAAARLHSGKPTTRKHSALYEWLWTRYSGMARELNPPRTPNWAALANKFGALGILDGKGQAPRPITVRQTWAKVKQAKKAVALGGVTRRWGGENPAAVAAPPAAQPQATPPTPATTPMPAQLPPGIEPAEPDPPEGRYRFRLAGGPKVWTKDEPKPE